ncbi:MAG: hypothetical protein GXO18_00050 [Aquificae bacterium]|nr:hypothetical protein [Aquificota bacterium]
MRKVYEEIGKHFLSIGLAVVAYVLIKFAMEGETSSRTALIGIGIWLLMVILGSILIYKGGKDGKD